MKNLYRKVFYTVLFLSPFLGYSQSTLNPLYEGVEGMVLNLYADSVSQTLYVLGDAAPEPCITDINSDTVYDAVLAWRDGGWHPQYDQHLESAGGRIGITRFKGRLYCGDIYDKKEYGNLVPTVFSVFNDTTHRWDPVPGNKFLAPINTLKVSDDGNTLYIGGILGCVGCSEILGRASIIGYDGVNFFNATDSIPGSTNNNPYIYALDDYKGELYAVGNFSSSIEEFNDLARWDGVEWHSLGGGSSI